MRFEMTIQTRSAAAILILSAVVGACSGASAAPTPGPTGAPGQATAAPDATTRAGAAAAIDACALITQPEAKAFLGSDPGPGSTTGDASSSACAYGGSLTFVVQPDAGKAKFDSDKAAAAGSDKLHDLPGIGDGAYAFIVANTIAQMEVLKGSNLVTVNVQGDPSLQNITVATLTALATTVVARLP